MQILASIDFSRATFLTDSTAGFRDGRGHGTAEILFPLPAGPDRAVDCRRGSTRSGTQRRLRDSSIEITRGVRCVRNKKDEIPEPHTVSSRTIVRGNISPRSFALFLFPSVFLSPYPLFLPLAASKDLHFYCHSTRLKTRGYRGTHCIAHNLYLLVPLRWTLRCKHSPAPRRQVQARHLTNSSVI